LEEAVAYEEDTTTCEEVMVEEVVAEELEEVTEEAATEEPEEESEEAAEEEKGFTSDVKIAGDVVATIVALAATEIEGISYMQGNINNELVGKLGMKNLTKGVTIRFEEDGTSVYVEISVVMKYGYSIPKVCKAAQDRIKAAIENMAGLKVSNININIIGVETETAE